MKLSTLTFRMLMLAVVAIALARCDEGLNQVDLRQDVIQGGEECKELCGEPGFENAIVMDFAEFETNDVVSESKGVLINATNTPNPTLPVFTPLEIRVFDTDRTADELDFCNTFDDFDLLFPGGTFGNVIVIQDENSPNCANDRRRGGQINFDFTDAYPNGVTINCVDVLDTEEAGVLAGQSVNGAIVLFDELPDGTISQIGDLIPVPATADGEGQVIDIGVSGVDRMLWVVLGSGAISNICFTPIEPPQQEEGECENNGLLLDFEEFEEFDTISMSQGVMISGAPTSPVTFDTFDPDMCPQFDDTDMLFPGGEYGNILVNQHRGKGNCANADTRGGMLTFEFPVASTINSMDLFDTEESGGTVTFYGPGDAMISMVDIPVIADGEAQKVSPAVAGVVKMSIDFGGSGGVDNICYTPDPQ